MTTPRLGAPELTSGQATPETTVNEQIRYLESGAGHFIFKDRDLATPPGSPADGDCYLVAGSPTSFWTGHAGDIAFRMNTSWVFIEVIEGFTAWINDENLFVGYNGSAWAVMAGDVAGPASSVDNHVAIFDGTTGKLLKDGGVANLANGANITPAAAPATNAIGYLGSPQMSDQDDYTLVMADAGKHYYHVSGTPHTLTIPANASVAFPVGTVIAIINEDGAGDLSVDITSDTLRWTDQTGTRTIAENGTATLLKVAAGVWRMTGDGIT